MARLPRLRGRELVNRLHRKGFREHFNGGIAIIAK
jgi:hypothetical protein